MQAEPVVATVLVTSPYSSPSASCITYTILAPRIEPTW